VAKLCLRAAAKATSSPEGRRRAPVLAARDSTALARILQILPELHLVKQKKGIGRRRRGALASSSHARSQSSTSSRQRAPVLAMRDSTALARILQIVPNLDLCRLFLPCKNT
jgi:hypothetical protein